MILFRISGSQCKHKIIAERTILLVFYKKRKTNKGIISSGVKMFDRCNKQKQEHVSDT